MSNIAPFRPPRPPTGTWPPCPPPPCGPDFFSGIFWLQQNYEDVKRAQAFLRQMLTDIIKEDPTILSGGAPLAGVTDGSDAQPGMVGEFLHFSAGFSYPAAVTTQMVSAGVLPPGDWDVWAWAGASVPTTGMNFHLSPVPPGFSGDLTSGFGLGGIAEATAIVAPAVRALISVPTLLAFSLQVDPTAAGTVGLEVSARRCR